MAPVTEVLRTIPSVWQGSKRLRVREAVVGYLFVLPVVLLFLVYELWPIARSFWISLTNYTFIGNNPIAFVGIDNYVRALGDKFVLIGLVKGLYFALLNYAGGLFFPLIVAIVLDRVRNPLVAAFYRVSVYFPAVIPNALIWKLWIWIYLPSIGLLNYVLYTQLRLLSRQYNWLDEATLVLPSMMIVLWWETIGTRTIFFLIGLQGVPHELYEAARLDGANELQVTWHVSLPLLKNTIMVWTIISVGFFAIAQPMLIVFGSGFGAQNFQVFPDSVQTWSLYAYTLGFASAKMPLGYATAVSWVGGFVMLILAFVLRRLFIEKE